MLGLGLGFHQLLVFPPILLVFSGLSLSFFMTPSALRGGSDPHGGLEEVSFLSAHGITLGSPLTEPSYYGLGLYLPWYRFIGCVFSFIKFTTKSRHEAKVPHAEVQPFSKLHTSSTSKWSPEHRAISYLISSQ